VKRTPLKRKPWRRALGTAEQRLAFKSAVLEADGDCVMQGAVARYHRAPYVVSVPAPSCDGPLQAAHVIRKHTLRKLGYGADVVYSVDAAMTLCRAHHELHDSYSLRVPEELWPARCREFVKRINEERVA
jgi:hypothetical protein